MKTLQEIEYEFGAFSDAIEEATNEDDECKIEEIIKQKVKYYKENIYQTDMKDKLLRKNPGLRFVFRELENELKRQENE